MDSGDQDHTRGHYSSIKARTRLESRAYGARVAAIVFAILGGVLVAASILATELDDYPRLALLNGGLACFIWAGHMVVGWGAVGGHLTIFRLVEHCTEVGVDKMETAIGLEERNGQIIGDVLEDDLRRRRNGG
jgi:hypothetical protein